jgi:L-seryl-tRNA(Ser) seleniumtransferase
MNDKSNERLRQIPKFDRIIEREPWVELAGCHGMPYVKSRCHRALEAAKKRIREGDPAEVDAVVDQELEREYLKARLEPLQHVVNATGVVLHTNLGRAPFGRDIADALRAQLTGSVNLEIDLLTGKRGIRGPFVRETLARICRAEDALVVNNNAAAVLLTVSVMAAQREVIVSRGELIQIGGGFRIPDVIQQGGARLREVGTSNITTLDDYRRAMGPETGALLKVHLSNFNVDGFADRPSVRELASLKSDAVPLIEDLGSGSLLTHFGKRSSPDPTPAQSLADGADLVCFSGDKLLGGVQAGLIVGRRELVDRLASFPLMRAIRPDKLVYAILQVVLAGYERGEPERWAPWRQLQQGRSDIVGRIESFRERYGIDKNRHKIVETLGSFGAGSLPGETIESAALVVAERKVDSMAESFRRHAPPVLGIVHDGRFLLDFLTITEEEEAAVAAAIGALVGK